MILQDVLLVCLCINISLVALMFNLLKLYKDFEDFTALNYVLANDISKDFKQSLNCKLSIPNFVTRLILEDWI